MVKILNNLPQKIIEFSFYLLFFLVPLVLTPLNYELFEYNKMMLTYGLTTVIVGAWIIKIVAEKRFIIRRTPLDLPILLFLISQLISTFISLDRHVSIWGYYSRFNGGLLSTISYILLYFAFVSNFAFDKIRKLLKVALFSGLLVSVYGILEHFGIDKDIWVQDVQNRVFSTLGQPNWLAAYLAILISISIGFVISNIKDQISNKHIKYQKYFIFAMYFLSFIFYICLLFTKSRSGFLGFWISLIVLWFFSVFQALLPKLQSQKSSQIQAIAYICDKNIKLIGIYITSFIVITFIIGSPFPEINRFTLPALISNQQWSNGAMEQSIKPAGGSIIDVGITESGTIRQIVWSGAIDIFRHYPIFGTGVETFAFAYYKFRPVEHNMTSEWDFLYNKAHNEYLNYAATTGAFGLGSYLLIILGFIYWCIKRLKSEVRNGMLNYEARSEKLRSRESKNQNIPLQYPTSHFLLLTSLFTGYASILITNFFGFSVVIIQLFFFLIPAISFTLGNDSTSHSGERSDTRIIHIQNDSGQARMTILQYLFCFIITLSIIYILYSLSRLWYADVVFADGYHKVRSQETTSAYQTLKKALEINDNEPFYYDEFSYPAAQIAVALADEKQATLSAAITREAIIASNFAVSTETQNVNFWKTRTRVFYTLSTLDEKYFADALSALEQAKLLAPTDPKIRYNLGLLYDREGKKEDALKELEETTRLKSDYRDAFYALVYIYEKDNKRSKAKEMLQYILTKIATDDAEARKKLEELK